MQKVTFWLVKGILLQAKTRHIGNSLISSAIAAGEKTPAAGGTSAMQMAVQGHCSTNISFDVS